MDTNQVDEARLNFAGPLVGPNILTDVNESLKALPFNLVGIVAQSLVFGKLAGATVTFIIRYNRYLTGVFIILIPFCLLTAW